MGVFCCVTFHPLCKLSDCTLISTALGPTLTMDMLPIGPAVSQALFSPGHHRRSIEARSGDCSTRGSGPAVGAMGAAQTLAWPYPHVYVCTKSTAAKVECLGCGITRCPFRCSAGAELTKPVMGVSIPCLHSCKERFQLFPLVSRPLGPSCSLSPTSACWPPTGVCF